PCQVDEILDIAKRHNLKVIEDASHAHDPFAVAALSPGPATVRINHTPTIVALGPSPAAVWINDTPTITSFGPSPTSIRVGDSHPIGTFCPGLSGVTNPCQYQST
ncbi:MAG: DegT/DnrJ/EryC1/StrS family aminotransferase, partial [Pseudobacteriovorax sp.]|nr:DegT/DnrJ/EryC1/StrS family aminotransferase [Pseudobacteriovorax sp.]